MSFFGHIKRHDTLEKTILEGKLEGKRGKPRRVWTDDIKNLLEMSVKEEGNLAYDRYQYTRHSQSANKVYVAFFMNIYNLKLLFFHSEK